MNKCKKSLTSLTALLLAGAMFTPTLASCGKDKDKDDESKVSTYTYTDAFVTSPDTWNPHIYRTLDDGYPLDFTSNGLYEFFFNEDKTGYEIEPVMAAAEPEDVTAALKSESKWGIPSTATKGYAYKIKLNPNAKWDDGTPINADTYVDSMKLLLDPNYANYRASNYYTGSLVIKNAKAYAFNGLYSYNNAVCDSGYFNMPDITDTTGTVEAGAPTVEYDKDGVAWVSIALDDETEPVKHDVAMNLEDEECAWGAALSTYYYGGLAPYFWSDYYIAYAYEEGEETVDLTEAECETVVKKYFYTASDDSAPVEVTAEKDADGKVTYKFANGTALTADEARKVAPEYFFGTTAVQPTGYELPEGATDYYKELEKLENDEGMIQMTETAIGYLSNIIASLQTETIGATPEDYAKTAKEYAYYEWQEFCYYGKDYETIDFSNVGCYKSGEYEITLVLSKSLTGFYLLYNLSSNWLVKPDLYLANMKQDPTTKLWNSTYNTSVATSASYGPYKMTTYEEDKLMVFERNENWFGYSDERFEGMYQTTTIRSTYVKEASTRKDMFMKGELMTYGLQAEDYADYRMSDNFYTSPGTTIFFLVLYSNEKQLATVEKSKEGVNKTILANDDFREALSLCFDKDAFAAKISPSRSGAYSVVGSEDIWNPTSGEKYRDTTIAKEALAEYYGYKKSDNGKYTIESHPDDEFTLDQAVEAITGYNKELAKEKFLKAFEYWTNEGKYNKGDVVEIEYALSADNDFMTKTINELNAKIDEVLKGTDYEGKVKITKSAPLGNAWVTNLRNGTSQTSLCGWNGGMLDPFGSMLYYTEPSYDPYAKNWWATEKEELPITLPVGENGANEKITMTIQNWGLCLNGEMIEVDGKEYNFGYEQVDDNVRLTILAELEKAILATNYYIPLLQDGSGFLLTKKAQYALGPDDYNAVLGRGGIKYLTYLYDDAEWADYVADCGGTVDYK